MKIGFFADVHFKGGIMLPIISRAWHDAWQVFKAEGCIAVVGCGDLTEDQNLAIGAWDTAGDVIAAMLGPVAEADIETYLLPGNHDDIGPGHATSLEVFRGLPCAHIIDTPTILRIEGNGEADALVGTLPWEWNSHLLGMDEYRHMSEDEFTAAVGAKNRAKLRGFAASWHNEGGMKILAGHAEVVGAKNRYRELPPGSTHMYDLADLRATGAGSICLGHYHRRQMDVYIGSLVQLDKGEEGNPTGVMILDTETGIRKFVDIDAPRHVTIRIPEEENTFSLTVADVAERAEEQGAQPGDYVHVIGKRPPGEIELGITRWGKGYDFTPIADETATARLRVEGVNEAETVEDLFALWVKANDLPFTLDAVRDQFVDIMTNAPPAPIAPDFAGGIMRVVSIRISGIGAYREEQFVEFPETAHLIGIKGQTGAGKTTLLEAICLAAWNASPFYAGQSYELLAPLKGEKPASSAMIEVTFDALEGRFRMQRKWRITPATQTCKAYLWRLDPEASKPVDIAGSGREKEFSVEIRRIIGDMPRFIATVFQSQHDNGSLINAEPGDRQKFMRSYTGADRFDGTSKYAHGKTKDANDAVTLTRAQIGSIGDAAAAVDVAQTFYDDAYAGTLQCEAFLETAAQNLASAEGTLTEAAGTVERERARLDQAARIGAQGRAVKAEHEALLLQCQQAEGAEAELTRVRQQLESVTTLQTTLRAAQEAMLMTDGCLQQAQSLGMQRQALEAQQAARTAQRAAERRAIESERSAEVGRLAADHRARAAELDRAVDQAGAKLANEKSMLQQQVLALKRDIPGLEAKAKFLENAGCKPGTQIVGGCLGDFLPCAFIDDARGAPEKLLVLKNNILHRQQMIDTNAFGQAEREALQQAEAARAAHDTASAVNFDPAPYDARIAALDAQNAQVDPGLQAQIVQIDAQVAALPLSTENLQTRHAAEAEAQACEAALRAIDIPRLQASLPTLESAMRDLESLRGLAAQKASELGVLRQQLKATEFTDSLLPAAEAAAEQARQHYTACQRGRDDAQRNLLTQSTKAAGAQERLEAAKAHHAKLLVMQITLKTQESTAGAWAMLDDFFSPRGVPQLIIDGRLPRINELMANLMRNTLPEWQIEFKTLKDNKSGTTTEGLYINVTDANGHTRDLVKHSGGEQNLLRETVRQGLSLHESERSGAHHGIFCVDEPTNGLDSILVPHVMENIADLTQRFNQVFVVSHDTRITQGMQYSIECSRTPPRKGPTLVRVMT